MANKCKDCGCTCKRCTSSDHDIQLHVEIENLKQKLLEKESHIVTMETHFLNEANETPTGEMLSLREELLTWQDKYKRLYEAHRRVQRVNQGLEDKLLKLVDVCETEKSALTKDVATLSHNLADANYINKKLTEENDRYKNDVSLAIQFLQCKQSNFVVHRYDSLPPEVQAQVSHYMVNKRTKPEEKKSPEVKSIKVPIPTFPPTAMVYSIPKSPNPSRKEEDVEAGVDIVSAAIMAKVLEERQKERETVKHCDTCNCAKTLKIVHHNSLHSIGTQTDQSGTNMCLKCNDVGIAQSKGMQIVRNPDIQTKHVPVHPIIISESNIVKVQPNNFLANKNSKTNSSSSSLTEMYRDKPKQNLINANTHVINNEVRNFQEYNLQKTHNFNERAAMLCKLNDSTSSSEMQSSPQKETTRPANVMIKHNYGDNLRGPRYCSMRVKSGSNNILLDNAHSNVEPVLYTHMEENKLTKVKNLRKFEKDSCTSSENLLVSYHSDNSTQHQQRVAEWVNNNIENDNSSSPDNSRAESITKTANEDVVNAEKFTEMEENVKRFLFGESEFLKTVEIGKLKYKNYRDTEGDRFKDKSQSSISVHTETEI